MRVKFFLADRNRNETTVAEEHCWAITQAAGLSWFSVLEFELHLDSLLYIYNIYYNI
jgi:hypothetical protein